MHRLKHSLPFLAFILAIAALPLLYSSQTLDPVLMPRFTIVSISAMVTGVLLLLFRKDFLPLSFPVVPFLFMGLFLLSGFIAAFGSSALSEVYFVIGKDLLMLVFLFPLLNFSKEHFIKLFTKAVVVFSLLLIATSLAEIMQLGHLPSLEETYAITGNMAHRNLLASALALCLPFTVYASWDRDMKWKIAGILLSLSSLALILSLQSRGAFIGLCAFLAVLTVLWLVRRFGGRPLEKSLTWAAAIAGIILTIGFAYLYYFSKPATYEVGFKGHFGISDDANQNFTTWERMLMWESTGKMILNEPVQGVGPGQWKILFPKYSPGVWRTRQGMVQFQRPHNDFLWVWSEQGLAGLIFWLGLFVSVFLVGIKYLINPKNPERHKDLVQLLIGLIGIYLAVSFFSFPRERIAHQLLLFTAIAGILTISRGEATWKGLSLRSSLIVVSLLSLLCVPLVIMGFSRWKGESLTREILKDRSSSDWESLIKNHARIEKSNFYTIDPTSVPMGFYAGLAQLNLQNLEEAEWHFKEAYAIHPYNIHVINNLANTYQLKGDFTNALIYYKKALQVAPYYRDGVLNLAAAYFNNQNTEMAYYTLAENQDKFDEDTTQFRAYLTSVLEALQHNYLQENETPKYSDQVLDSGELLKLHRSAQAKNVNISVLIQAELALRRDSNQYVPELFAIPSQREK